MSSDPQSAPESPLPEEERSGVGGDGRGGRGESGSASRNPYTELGDQSAAMKYALSTSSSSNSNEFLAADEFPHDMAEDSDDDIHPTGKRKRESGSGRSKKSKGSRKEVSLNNITEKFISMITGSKDGSLDLNEAALRLGVPKRRLYDITNVLEGCELISKSKNRVQWKGDIRKFVELGRLQQECSNLELEEQALVEQFHSAQCDLKKLQERAVINIDDVRVLPEMQQQHLIIIKAPSGATLDCFKPHKGTVAIELKSQGKPIDVWYYGHLGSEPQQTRSLPQPQMHLSPRGSMQQPQLGLVDMLASPGGTSLLGEQAVDLPFLPTAGDEYSVLDEYLGAAQDFPSLSEYYPS